MIFITGGAYSGKTEYALNTYGKDKKIINRFHLVVREALAGGKNPHEETERILSENPDIIISDEIGCGIVPTDKFEREWRETCGRLCCMLSKRADMVIRVVCGIGVRIK